VLLCSNAKHDINLLQLQQLYNKVSKQHNLASGTATQRSFFQHWEQLSGMLTTCSPGPGSILTSARSAVLYLSTILC
jgi:hypothetical protein